jgi:hypothetical protein
VKLIYYRDLAAYGDGTYLYVSKSGITKSSWGVGDAFAAKFMRRRSPDLLAEHWGGFAGGPLQLYRRDAVRKWFGSPSRSKLRLPKYPSDFLGMPLPDEVERA